MNAHLEFLRRIRNATALDAIPGRDDLTAHIDARVSPVGDKAFEEFAHLQRVAACVWGAGRTSHFAIVLRNARVAPKRVKNDRWQKPQLAIKRLPMEWRMAMQQQADMSKSRSSIPGLKIWGPDYTLAVSLALGRWAEYARVNGLALVPTGATLERYANWLIDPSNADGRVSQRATSDYISRINAGLRIVEPSSASNARAFVVRYWRERAKSAGTPTKTGKQLVGAVTIYDHGFDLIAAARARPVRGVRAATVFRNGLILVIGVSLPQRARALSALAFGSTLRILGDGAVHVRIPAEMLKVPEDCKDGDPFDVVWHNARLAAVLEEFRRDFRPLFDNGSCLFPNVHAPGQSISEKQIGVLAGDMTKSAFGVRIPIHRFRDNVATESSEHLTGGRLATAVLLR